MSPSRKRRMSTGELISSVAFFGFGLWLIDEAAAIGGLRGIGLGLCAVACLAAALRFVIARLWEKYRTRD